MVVFERDYLRIDIMKGNDGIEMKTISKQGPVFHLAFLWSLLSVHPGQTCCFWLVCTECLTAWILGFTPFSEMSFVPLSSSFHSPGCPFSLQLIVSAHREVEPTFSAQRQPELLHCEVAATAPGQLPLPAQLLLQG